MKTLLSLAILAAAVTAQPAFAGQPAAAPAGTVVVRTADLDLTSRSGVAALDRRIRTAVREACGASSDTDLQGRNADRKCRAETRASAVPLRDSAIANARLASPTLASK